MFSTKETKKSSSVSLCCWFSSRPDRMTPSAQHYIGPAKIVKLSRVKGRTDGGGRQLCVRVRCIQSLGWRAGHFKLDCEKPKIFTTRCSIFIIKIAWVKKRYSPVRASRRAHRAEGGHGASADVSPFNYSLKCQTQIWLKKQQHNPVHIKTLPRKTRITLQKMQILAIECHYVLLLHYCDLL